MWPPRETTTKTRRSAPRPDAVDITDKCVKPFTVLSNQYAQCPGNTFLFSSVAVAYLSVMRRGMSSSERKIEDHAANSHRFPGMDFVGQRGENLRLSEEFMFNNTGSKRTGGSHGKKRLHRNVRRTQPEVPHPFPHSMLLLRATVRWPAKNKPK